MTDYPTYLHDIEQDFRRLVRSGTPPTIRAGS